MEVFKISSKILIVGSGVIGSIYSLKFSNAGFNVTILARGSRLEQLEKNGLIYEDNGNISKANVTVISNISDDDLYDFIFVTVRFEQIIQALNDIKSNKSKTIITMVNSPKGYDEWERIVGKGRLIAAFPGAGGRIEKGVLYYRLTPYIIQPTTFGELNGIITHRVHKLAQIFKTSKVPYNICRDMDAWQKSHLAMVIPMAKAIYNDGGTAYTTSKNKLAIEKMCLDIKDYYRSLKKIKIPITPMKLNAFLLCPIWLLKIIMKALYSSRFAETLISNHANNAKQEMLLLDLEFQKVVDKKV